MILPQPLCFVTDCTLGRLAKWLRLMGFDARYDSRAPDARHLMHLASGNRLILTRSQNVAVKLPGSRVLLIGSEQPASQIRQLIGQLDIHREQLRPFSRCANCNVNLDPLPRSQAAGRIPDFVLIHHRHFHQCPQCRRIFWPGTHCRRWEQMITTWFDHLDYEVKGDNQQ